jgi:putative flippase GtrA
MASLVSRALAFRRSAHFRRLWKYASVSIISTLVTQVVLFLTYHVLSWGSAMECNVIATVVASVPAYYLNRTWTWGKRGRSSVWSEVVPFWSIALIAMVLSTAAVGVAAHNADRISHGSLERALIVNCANLFTYAVLWTARYFVLNRWLFGARTIALPAEAEGTADAESVAEAETHVERFGGEGVALARESSDLAPSDTIDRAG